jgi:hypothetical protein
MLVPKKVQPRKVALDHESPTEYESHIALRCAASGGVCRHGPEIPQRLGADTDRAVFAQDCSTRVNILDFLLPLSF